MKNFFLASKVFLYEISSEIEHSRGSRNQSVSLPPTLKGEGLGS